MKTHRKQSLALASISLAALFGTASCNALLGIDGDEYRDVAVEMCGCDNISVVFSDCTNRVRTQLATAEPEERERWLGEFEARNCGACNDGFNLATCLQTPPVCRDRGEPCGAVFDCCGVLAAQRACIEGRCVECIPPNDPAAPGCTANTDCCGSLREGEVYCYEGRCVEQATGCNHSFDVCSDSSECCGQEALLNGLTGLGGCGKDPDDPGPSRCFESCAPGGANCPGCCARIEDGPNAIGSYACLDGPATAAGLEPLIPPGSTLCEALCELGVDEECPQGSSCTVLQLDGGVGLHVCQLLE